MAICTLNKNLLKSNSCDYVLNEVKDLYIIDFNSVTQAKLNYDCDTTTGTGTVQVTGLTVASGANFSHIEPSKNSVTYTDELVVEDSGAKYRTHTVTFGLSGNYNKDLVCSVDALSLGRFFVVVKTASGQYLVLGRSTGLEASEQAINGGSDNNGITVTLSANVAESAAPLSDEDVTYLLQHVIA